MDDVKTEVPTMSQDKSRGNLFTAWVASGIKAEGAAGKAADLVG